MTFRGAAPLNLVLGHSACCWRRKLGLSRIVAVNRTFFCAYGARELEVACALRATIAILTRTYSWRITRSISVLPTKNSRWFRWRLHDISSETMPGSTAPANNLRLPANDVPGRRSTELGSLYLLSLDCSMEPK